MTEIRFDYRPLPVHTGFHTSTAHERALFGAFGSGKSYAGIAEVIAWCLEQPGIRGVVARYTVPELRDTTEPIFFEMLPAELMAAGTVRRTGGHYESFTFPNGSTVLFRSLDDWNKWRSLNLGFIFVDEANEIDEESYQGIVSRLRQRDLTAEASAQGYTHEITRQGIWVATNPNGQDWLWHRFVDKAEGSRAWFRSTSLDNPYLPPGYIDQLLQYPEPWVRRYVLCTFDDFGGQIYEDFTLDTHVVPPFKLDPQDVIWMGMDPGTRNPTAGLWVHVDTKSRTLTGVAEYEQHGLAAVQHAANWRRIEAKLKVPVKWRVADPNIMTRDRGTNMELHTQYARLGYHFQLGPRMHKIRIPALGQLIAQGRFKLTTECPLTYEAIKNYRWEDITPAMRAKGVDPKDTPLKKNDHLVDCAQYVASRWVSPDRLTMVAREFDTPHAQFSYEAQQAIRKQQRRRARSRGRRHDMGGIAV